MVLLPVSALIWLLAEKAFQTQRKRATFWSVESVILFFRKYKFFISDFDIISPHKKVMTSRNVVRKASLSVSQTSHDAPVLAVPTSFF